MIENVHKNTSGVTPLLRLIDTVLSRSSSVGLTEEDVDVLTEESSLLAVMQRMAFQAMRQEREQTPRLNTDFSQEV